MLCTKGGIELKDKKNRYAAGRNDRRTGSPKGRRNDTCNGYRTYALAAFIGILAMVACVFAVGNATDTSADAEVISQGMCGESTEYQLYSDGVLKIFGTGATYDYDTSNPGWYDYRTTVTTLTIGSGVTTLGKGLLKDLSNVASFQIPSGVTSLDQSTFDGMSSLKAFSVHPDNVKYFDSRGFLMSHNLVTVGDEEVDRPILLKAPLGVTDGYVILPGVTYSVGSKAFYNNDSIMNVQIPESVKEIGAQAFYDCDNINSVAVREGIAIGESAFRSCDKLYVAYICDGCSVGSNAFADCAALEAVFVDPRLEGTPYAETTFAAGSLPAKTWHVDGEESETIITTTAGAPALEQGKYYTVNHKNTSGKTIFNTWYPLNWYQGTSTKYAYGVYAFFGPSDDVLVYKWVGARPVNCGWQGGSWTITYDSGSKQYTQTYTYNGQTTTKTWTDDVHVWRTGTFNSEMNPCAVLGTHKDVIVSTGATDCVRMFCRLYVEDIYLPSSINYVAGQTFTGVYNTNAIYFHEKVPKGGEILYDCNIYDIITTEDALLSFSYPYLTERSSGDLLAIARNYTKDVIVGEGTQNLNSTRGANGVRTFTLSESVTTFNSHPYETSQYIVNLGSSMTGSVVLSGVTINVLQTNRSASNLSTIYANYSSVSLEVLILGGDGTGGAFTSNSTTKNNPFNYSKLYRVSENTATELSWFSSADSVEALAKLNKNVTSGGIYINSNSAPAIGTATGSYSAIASDGSTVSGTNTLYWYVTSKNVLVIWGTGYMPDFTSSGSGVAPWDSSDYTDVCIQEGITSIGKNAFYGKSSLVYCSIPKTVTSIGVGAFDNTGLTSVYLPSALKDVCAGGSASDIPFNGCSSLEQIVQSKGPLNNEGEFYVDTTYISSENILYSGTSGSYTAIRAAPAMTGSAALIDGTVAVSKEAFKGSRLTSLGMPSTVVTLGDSAFEGSSLTTIALGTITTLGSNVLKDCTSLQEVVIAHLPIESGKTKADMGTLLVGCSAIQILKINEPMTVSSANLYSGLKIYQGMTQITPVGGVYDLKAGTYTTFPLEAQNRIPGTGIFWDVSGTTLLFQYRDSTMTNIMPSYASATTPWNGYLSSADSLTIYEGVYNAGAHAFKDMAALTNLSVSNLYRIDDSAFLNDTLITGVSFGNSLQTIGDNAFKGTSLSGSLTIPASVTSVGDEAFMRSTSAGTGTLTAVNLGNNVVSVGDRAFAGHGGMSIVYFGSPSVVTVGDNAFSTFVGSVYTDMQFINADTQKSAQTITGVIPGKSTFVKFAPEAVYLGENLQMITAGNVMYIAGYGDFYLYDSLASTAKTAWDLANQTEVHIVGASSIDTDLFADGHPIHASMVNLQITGKPTLGVAAYSEGAFKDCIITDLTVPVSVDCSTGFSGVTTLKNLTVTGSKSVVDYTSTYAETPWHQSLAGFADLSITSDVTALGAYMFCGLPVESIDLSNVTSIGAHAFDGAGMTSVTLDDSMVAATHLPGTVMHIGDSAFDGCSLKTVRVTAPYGEVTLKANGTNQSFKQSGNLIVAVDTTESAVSVWVDSDGNWVTSFEGGATYSLGDLSTYKKNNYTASLTTTM